MPVLASGYSCKVKECGESLQKAFHIDVNNDEGLLSEVKSQQSSSKLIQIKTTDDRCTCYRGPNGITGCDTTTKLKSTKELSHISVHHQPKPYDMGSLHDNSFIATSCHYLYQFLCTFHTGCYCEELTATFVLKLTLILHI